LLSELASQVTNALVLLLSQTSQPPFTMNRKSGVFKVNTSTKLRSSGTRRKQNPYDQPVIQKRTMGPVAIEKFRAQEREDMRAQFQGVFFYFYLL
jgi:hypothetical protein